MVSTGRFETRRITPETLYFDRMLRRSIDLQGEIVECGVGKGLSLCVLASLLDVYGLLDKGDLGV